MFVCFSLEIKINNTSKEMLFLFDFITLLQKPNIQEMLFSVLGHVISVKCVV